MCPRIRVRPSSYAFIALPLFLAFTKFYNVIILFLNKNKLKKLSLPAQDALLYHISYWRELFGFLGVGGLKNKGTFREVSVEGAPPGRDKGKREE